MTIAKAARALRHVIEDGATDAAIRAVMREHPGLTPAQWEQAMDLVRDEFAIDMEQQTEHFVRDVLYPQILRLAESLAAKGSTEAAEMLPELRANVAALAKGTLQ